MNGRLIRSRQMVISCGIFICTLFLIYKFFYNDIEYKKSQDNGCVYYYADGFIAVDQSDAPFCSGWTDFY